MEMKIKNTREMNANLEDEVWDWGGLKHSINIEFKRLWKLIRVQVKERK